MQPWRLITVDVFCKVHSNIRLPTPQVIRPFSNLTHTFVFFLCHHPVLYILNHAAWWCFENRVIISASSRDHHAAWLNMALLITLLMMGSSNAGMIIFDELYSYRKWCAFLASKLPVEQYWLFLPQSLMVST